MSSPSFSTIAIVSCGTLSLELNHLKTEGFLDTPQIYYTTPGLHQDIPEMERQLVRLVTKAKEKHGKVIVVYGGKFCYVNVDEPTRLMQTLVQEQGAGVARIDATHCMDMLADETERNRIAQEVAGGEPVWWMTAGGIKFRKDVVKGWAPGLAHENFPKHPGGASGRDGPGYLDTDLAADPDGGRA